MLKKKPFGIPYYEPRHKTLPDRVIEVSTQKVKRETFVDTIAREKYFVPGPKYKTAAHIEWSEKQMTPTVNPKIGKAARNTFLDKIH